MENNLPRYGIVIHAWVAPIYDHGVTELGTLIDTFDDVAAYT